jgi:hypothetical protein
VGRCLDTLVEGPQALIALASPEFGETRFNGVGGVFLSLSEAGLKVGNSKDRLEGGVDPTGSVLVAKTEHGYFWKAEKSVRKGVGSVLDEYEAAENVWATL